jgi:DNA-directed primase/polymerase protein
MHRTASLKHVFQKQDAAFAFADAQPSSTDAYDKCRVFSCEKLNSSSGSRKYIVASYRAFWKVYKRLPDSARFYYEVIREQDPCYLYFDIEYSRSINPTVDGARVMSILFDELSKAIMHHFQLELKSSDIVDLDASSSAKFSRHWIVRSCVFKTNLHAGLFVRMLMIQLYSSMIEGNQQLSDLFLPVRVACST